MLQEVLEKGMRALGVEMDSGASDKLIAHIGHVLAWNRKMNLTAITIPKEMIVRHVLDSLSISRFVRGPRVLDVGSGAGFPGLPIAIIQPELEVVLVESRGKKAEFLRYVIGQLGIGNVVVENGRIEHYRSDEKFDTLMARAFSSLSELVRLTGHLSITGCRILAMKGKNPETETAQLQQSLQDALNTVKLDVPYLNADRYVVVIDV